MPNNDTHRIIDAVALTGEDKLKGMVVRMVKKQKIKCRAAVLVVCAVILFGGCGIENDKAEEREKQKQNVQEESVLESNVKEKINFEAVPYFKNDYGSNTQLVDGWIYSYWSRRLCRYNPETMEEQVLYEALSPQDGSFCVEGDYIYFIDKPDVSFVGRVVGTLYRMRCDGSELTELVTELPLSEDAGYWVYYHYDMMVYEDILYLLPGVEGTEHAFFFQLNGENPAVQVGVEQTVYGKVREPYSDASFHNRYSKFPPLPYCLKHYGYGFVVNQKETGDSEGALYYYDLESVTAEQVRALDVAGRLAGPCTLTNDAIVYQDINSVWHTVELGKHAKEKTIGVLDCYYFDFWDEKGIYAVEREEDHLRVKRLGWDGEEETLHYWIRSSRLSTSVYGGYVRLLYSDGKYLYYDSMSGGDGVIDRILLEDGSAEPEQFAVYYDSPVKDISTRETISTTYRIDETGDAGEFSVTKVTLTEDTMGAAKINARLEELYAGQQEYMKEVEENVRELSFSELKSDYRWSSTLAEVSYTTSIDYLDDNYIGFCVSWYQYWDGAAHGIYGATHYVFDRESGEKLELADVMENTSEDICKIIAPYVEAVAEWGTDEQGWEYGILDEGRFYLTTEGVGIHFDVYEITCYAAGSQDVVVPYEKFLMKNNAEKRRNDR